MAEPPIALRPAHPADAYAIASINVDCWQQAYAHILDPVLLAQRSVEDAAHRGRDYLSEPSPDLTVIVAEEAGRVLGFGSCGVQRDEELRGDGFAGEVSSLYVRMSEHRRGIGGVLMRGLSTALIDAGHASFSLWVLADNVPGRRFYESMAGRPLPRTRREPRLGNVVEHAYGWRDFAGLPFPTLSTIPTQGDRA